MPYSRHAPALAPGTVPLDDQYRYLANKFWEHVAPYRATTLYGVRGGYLKPAYTEANTRKINKQNRGLPTRLQSPRGFRLERRGSPQGYYDLLRAARYRGKSLLPAQGHRFTERHRKGIIKWAYDYLGVKLKWSSDMIENIINGGSPTIWGTSLAHA